MHWWPHIDILIALLNLKIDLIMRSTPKISFLLLPADFATALYCRQYLSLCDQRVLKSFSETKALSASHVTSKTNEPCAVLPTRLNVSLTATRLDPKSVDAPVSWESIGGVTD